MSTSRRVNGSSSGRAPTWDTTALRAGALVALVIAVPLWIGASWAADRDQWGLTAVLTLGALLGFVFGAACAAWIQTLQLPLAHGLVTAVGTYVTVQVVVTVYRLAVGNDVNWFSAFFYVTLAAGAGFLGGILGSRLRASGFVPSSQRRLDLEQLRGSDEGREPR